MNAIICKRCNKVQTNDNDIDVVIDIYKLKIVRGHIKQSLSLDEVNPYWPMSFTEKMFGEIYLCSGCLSDFMSHTKTTK